MRHTYIIAEVGNTHEGSFGLAQCFIRSAAECGADAIKFQTHLFDAESLPDAPNPPYFHGEPRKAYFDRTGFSLEQWTRLRRLAEEEYGLDFLSSPFSLEAVDLLEQAGVKGYKIASGEVSNLPLLIRVAQTGKKTYLSSGMSSFAELDAAVAALRENDAPETVLLQCTSEYPCPPEAAGLNLLGELAARYGLPVGFSDHTLGPAVPLAAVCLGAVVLEKHFTLSKRMYGPDPPFSAEPAEFKLLADAVRDLDKALDARLDKDAKAASLAGMKRIFEKSVVAARDLPAGAVLAPGDLAYKKPGDGIPAARFRDVLGRKLASAVGRDSQLAWDDLA